MPPLLIVEDEPALAMLAVLTLEDAGFEVLLAPNGEKGLMLARQAKPPLIITDFMMPVLDGVQMLRALRAEGLVMTAILTSALPEDRLPKDAASLYHAYLGKPYMDDELVALVREHLAALETSELQVGV